MSKGLSRERVRGCALLTVWIAVFVGSSIHAASDRGRVTGRVKDADGKPLAGVTLTISPVDAALGDARTVETNKKGRFSDLRFPAGAWTLSPSLEGYFLESLTFSLLDKDGLKRASWGAKAHPKDGFPAFEVPAAGTVRLDLVAADAEAGASLAKGAAWAQNAGTIDQIGELFNAGKSEETLEAAEALLLKEPGFGPAIYLKGAALNRLGRREEAVKELRKARELLPDQEGVAGMLGEALLGQSLDLSDSGQADAARPLAIEAAGLLAADLQEGSAFGTVWNYALALKIAGNTDELTPVLQGLTTDHPAQPSPFQELAEMQFQAGDREAALATLEKMPAAGATNGAILLFNQALNLFDAEEHDAALGLLERAKVMDPGFVMAHNLQAQILLSKGDRDGAAAALRRFIDLAPDGQDTSGAQRTLDSLMKNSGGE